MRYEKHLLLKRLSSVNDLRQLLQCTDALRPTVLVKAAMASQKPPGNDQRRRGKDKESGRELNAYGIRRIKKQQFGCFFVWLLLQTSLPCKCCLSLPERCLGRIHTLLRSRGLLKSRQLSCRLMHTLTQKKLKRQKFRSQDFTSRPARHCLREFRCRGYRSALRTCPLT